MSGSAKCDLALIAFDRVAVGDTEFFNLLRRRPRDVLDRNVLE
jgi:hypothetical protein